jgi:MoaA/NifB/PqqE/SkfB family radical SAM enzyme
MNKIKSATELVTKFKRHRAILHPKTAQFAYHWMNGTTELPYGPIKLHVEPTSLCNLRCIMCPQSLDEVQMSDTGFMDMDLYRSIIDQARGSVREINLFFRGESFLHKRIFEMVRICEEAGIVAHISTNATMLTEDYIRQLLDSGLSKLTISFDAGQKELYEKMRKGAKFERTLRNTLMLLHEKRLCESSKPYVVMQVIHLFGGDRNIQPTVPDDFKRRFEGLPVDEWDTFWAHGWAGTMGTGKDDYVAAPQGQHYFPCNWLWKSMAIYWDGTVPACCADFTNEQIVGDLNSDSLMDIWNGPEFLAIRTAHVAGRLDEYSLCRNCDAIWQDDGKVWSGFGKARALVTRAPLPELQVAETAARN